MIRQSTIPLALVSGLLLALLLVPPAWAEKASALPAPVRQALREAGIPEQAAALVVQDLRRPRPHLRFQADRPFNPASLMKLLTTRAALDILGPEHTWRTSFLATHPPHDEILDGDLILRGSGDPALTLERFWLLLNRLRESGVREIRGNFVLDRSLFASTTPEVLAPAFDDQTLRPYNVAPDALLLNFKSLRLWLTPKAQSLHPLLRVEPRPDNLDILNQIEQTANPVTDCTAWREGLRARYEEATAQRKARLLLEGHFPEGCGTQTWSLAPLSHADYVFGVFRSLWHGMGGTIRGTLILRDLPRSLENPNDEISLAEIESPPLRQLIADTNKYSNNVMARQLFLALGSHLTAANRGVLDSATSEAALRNWLTEKQLELPCLIIENGAGLSRKERLCAAELARLLTEAWNSPLMPEFLASLPLVGVDGTMRKRLQNEAIQGQAHIKTGTLDGVRALAGYVRDARGHWKIVVFMVNHPQAAHSKAAQDALLRWVYKGY